MDGFKKLPKMQCFKTGGSVAPKFKSVVEKTTKVAPTGNKVANAKSAAIAPKDKEAKVDISTMKKGGRAKKAAGTVKKFVKPSGDKDPIKKVAATSKKAAAPSKAAVKGKEIKKFAEGGLTGNPNALSIVRDPTYTDAFPNTGAPGSGPGLGAVSPIYQIDQGYGNGIGYDGNPINGGGFKPLAQQPAGGPGLNQPNFSPTFNNSNTMNANVGGEGGNYGGNYGGANPMTNPGGQQPITQQPAAQAPAAPASAGSVNVLPSLFGAK